MLFSPLFSSPDGLWQITANKKDLGRYCGRPGSTTGNHPGDRVFTSIGNRMRLFFSSDFSNEENGNIVSYKGFSAYYHAVGEYQNFLPLTHVACIGEWVWDN